MFTLMLGLVISLVLRMMSPCLLRDDHSVWIFTQVCAVAAVSPEPLHIFASGVAIFFYTKKYRFPVFV